MHAADATKRERVKLVRRVTPNACPSSPADGRTADDPMELCLPLIAEGRCLGILNVAFDEEVSGQDLQRGLYVIADRLAVGIALNRAVRGRSFA